MFTLGINEIQNKKGINKRSWQKSWQIVNTWSPKLKTIVNSSPPKLSRTREPIKTNNLNTEQYEHEKNMQEYKKDFFLKKHVQIKKKSMNSND